MRPAPDRGAAVASPDARFARLRAAQRVWAIAVIDGKAQRLAHLHDSISERFRDGDRVVYLGNYLGPAGAVLATIDELLDFRRRVLGRRGGGACRCRLFARGARGDVAKAAELQFAPNPGELLQWNVPAGVETTIRAYGGDLRQGFAACRTAPAQSPDGRAPCAAQLTRYRVTPSSSRPSGTPPSPRTAPFFCACRGRAVPALSEQRDAFWWGREDILELKEPFGGFRHVVRGVDRDRRGIVECEFAVSVDGGAGRGGRLIRPRRHRCRHRRSVMRQ
jgi:serine/threonine protein phosphatase 1